MNRQIRKASDLPAWFDRSNYDAAVCLDSAGWYEQLSVRETAATMVNDWPTLSESALDALSVVRKEPIVNVTKLDPTIASCYFLGGALWELKNKQLRYSPGVRLTTVRDLYLTEGNISNSKREYARNFFAQIFDENDDWFLKEAKYKCNGVRLLHRYANNNGLSWAS